MLVPARTELTSPRVVDATVARKLVTGTMGTEPGMATGLGEVDGEPPAPTGDADGLPGGLDDCAAMDGLGEPLRARHRLVTAQARPCRPDAQADCGDGQRTREQRRHDDGLSTIHRTSVPDARAPASRSGSP